MIVRPHDRTRYPKFSHYVKNDLPKIIDVPLIVSAMAKIGQLNRHKLKLALTWGFRPELSVVQLEGAYGEFTPNSHSNEIRIDQALVENFERNIGIRYVNNKNVYLVGVTILHELVHWGDDQDGVDRPGEEGAEFERAIYGRVIF